MLPHSHWQQKCQHTTRASAGWQKKNARKKFGMIFHFAFFFSISFSSFFSLNLWGIKEESSFHCVDCCWGGFFFSAPSLLCVLCFGDCERKVQMMKHFVIFAMRKRQGGKGGVGDEGGGWKSLWGWPYGKINILFCFLLHSFCHRTNEARAQRRRRRWMNKCRGLWATTLPKTNLLFATLDNSSISF